MRLETERLIIRGWTEQDIPRFAEICANPNVMKYIRDGSPWTYAAAGEYVQKQIQAEQERGWILWAVEHKETQDLMGFCGFAVWTREGGAEQEIGWRLDEKYWGQGYGGEAAQAVFDYGVKTYGFTKVIAVAQVENVASIQIMKRLGMQFERNGIDGDREIAVYCWEK